MNKRIVLLFLYDNKMDVTFEEIGICLIASYLREKGIEVKLIAKNSEQLEDEEIFTFHPDVLGFVVYQQNKYLVRKQCRHFKKIQPDIITCAGGVYATTNTLELLQETPELDFCVFGEGEETLYELMMHIDDPSFWQHIPGVAFRNMNGTVTKNPPRHLEQNLDTYPFAARDFLDKQKFGVVKIVGSRGCCAYCTYCTSKVVFPKWRYRSIRNIVDEIEFLSQKYGVKAFNFTDNSIEDPDKHATRIKELANYILKRGLEIKYNVYARADIYKMITIDEMHYLIRSGLWSLDIGVETANEDDFRLYGKSSDLADNFAVVRFLQSYPLRWFINFINFNPYSTFEGLQKNADYLHRFGSIMHYFSKLQIYNGTKIYKKVCKDGLFKYQLENGENRYRFVDQRIDSLYHFIDEYRNKDESRQNGLQALENSLRILPLQIQFLQQCIPTKGTVDVLESLNTQYNEIKKNMDTEFYHWFMLLLDSYRDGAEENGYEIVAQTHIEEKISDGLNSLGKIKKILFKIAIKNGIEVTE